MEHFKSPFGETDLHSIEALENAKFFAELMVRAQEHRFFTHPFMAKFGDGTASRQAVERVILSFYKIVSPFTSLLCSLAGRAPDLKSRFALMDNIYEEMGQGQLADAHPMLYQRMLMSIGIDAERAEGQMTLASIARINTHLKDVVEHKPFGVACAVLAGAEWTIPPSFPVLSAATKAAFPSVNMAFFDRHGPRDAGHSNDAAMLFAINCDPADRVSAEQNIMIDLDNRTSLFDEWLRLADQSA